VRADESNKTSIKLVRPLPYSLPQHTCGVYSFYLCARSVGVNDLTLSGLQQDLAPIGPSGVSLERLTALASEKHIPVQAIVTTLSRLIARDQPAILHVDRHHYIAFLGSNESGLVLFDSRDGLIHCPRERFAEVYDWQGTALAFGDPPSLFERAIAWPNVGLISAGVILIALAVRLIWGVV